MTERGSSNIEGLIDAGSRCSSRRVHDTLTGVSRTLDVNQEWRLDTAITAARTVLEPPSAPTDKLRAMGLWSQ
jgi:hypothetical protein